MTSDESRLSRWSRRKAEVRDGRGGATPELREENVDLPVDAAQPGETGQDALANETPPPDLPDIESLTADSDFTAFMKQGVPKALRRQALRKLWSSDPVFNVIDGMEEYGEDYTDAATVIKGMKSAWEVGKGYPKKEKQEAALDPEEPVGSEESADGESDEKDVPDVHPTVDDGAGEIADEDDEDLG